MKTIWITGGSSGIGFATAKEFLLNGWRVVISSSNKVKLEKAKKILANFKAELKNFKQVCPIEMLDKLDNPITLRSHSKKAG